MECSSDQGHGGRGMSDLISTRRAIEICLARLPMCGQARNAMAHHLAR